MKEPTRKQLQAIEEELRNHAARVKDVDGSLRSGDEARLNHYHTLKAEAEARRREEEPAGNMTARAFSVAIMGRLEREAAAGDEQAARLVEYYRGIRARVEAGEELAPPAPPSVTCSACRDTGFVRYDVPAHDPRFGRSLPCPKCGWAQQRTAIEATWRVPEATIALVGEDILPLAPPIARMIKLVERVIAAQPRGALILIDGGKEEGYGTAKTHALAHIYAGLWDSGKTTALYTTAMALEKTFTLFDDDEAAALRRDDNESAASAGAERARRWKHLQKVGFLLIDEAARYTRKDGNGWVERHMMELVDSRLANGKTVIMAGNHLLGDANGADRIHPALIDRARSGDGFILSLEGVASARKGFARNAGNWHEGV